MSTSEQDGQVLMKPPGKETLDTRPDAPAQPWHPDWWDGYLRERALFESVADMTRDLVLSSVEVTSSEEERGAAESLRAKVSDQLGRWLRDLFAEPGAQRDLALFLVSQSLAQAGTLAADRAKGEGLDLTALPQQEYDRRLDAVYQSDRFARQVLQSGLFDYVSAMAHSVLEQLSIEEPPELLLPHYERILVALRRRRPRTPPRIPKQHRLRTSAPQQTSPEIKEATMAMADAPLLRGWGLIDGEIALSHSTKDSLHQVKFVVGPLVQWLGRPNTIESLWAELRTMGLQAALLYHVIIAELLEHGSIIVALDSLITAIGWDPRSTDERQGMRQTLWRWIVCFVSWEIVGKRRSVHKDPVTKQPLDLTTFTPMIRLGERGYATNTQLAMDASTPPFEVELEPSSWLAQFRGNDNVLWYFGDVRRLASIKAGKPSGAWAQAIGLALQQFWRERAARAEVIRVGDDHKLTVRFQRPFTRRELLTMFPPNPTVEAVIEGKDPGRAKKYWDEAIGLLKQQDVIGFYEEPKEALPRQGWAKDWLDQPLDIRPTREGIAAVVEIATRKREADKRRKRAKSPAVASPT